MVQPAPERCARDRDTREGRPIERGVGEALKAGITRPQLAQPARRCQWFQGVNTNIRER